MPDFLYLDIETVPSQDPAIQQRIAETVKPPSNYTKPETIAKWEAESKPAAVRDALAKLSFDGGLGHCICVGWAVNGAVPDALVIDDVKQERALLQTVFNEIEKAKNPNRPVTLVGHHVAGFDIRFLWQRCVVLGVEFPNFIRRDYKPWDPDLHDTMTMWAGARDTISMDKLCEALGLSGKGDISGADVADIWSRGNTEQIASYCAGDIERTRNIHLKMLAAMGELPAWAREEVAA